MLFTSFGPNILVKIQSIVELPNPKTANLDPWLNIQSNFLVGHKTQKISTHWEEQKWSKQAEILIEKGGLVFI